MSNRTVNDFIRKQAGRGGKLTPEAQAPTPAEIEAAQRYAAIVGLTLSEALAALAEGQAPVAKVDGNAGAGTQTPPQPPPDVNAIIRGIVRAKRIGG